MEIKKTKDEVKQKQQLDRLKEISSIYKGEDEIISSLDFSEYLKNRPEEFKINSGWKKLDKILGGFRLKQVITISAFTKSGKTQWSMDLTNKFKEFNPLWFPLEEGAEELINKFIERKEETPLFYFSRKAQHNNLEWIEQKIIESISKFNSKIIFIDQLDFLVPYKTGGDSHHLRIAHTMRELKRIAVTWDVVVFLIAHLKQPDSITNQPAIQDLRGDASIAQESDTVILLWREAYRLNGQISITNNLNVSIQANRKTGKTGNIKMVCENNHFIENEWETIAEREAVADKDFEKF